MALMRSGSTRGSATSGGEMTIYTALLGVAAFTLLVSVVWVALANMSQTEAGGGGGSMFGLVSSR
jgi:membrane protein involved in colicin uptake